MTIHRWTLAIALLMLPALSQALVWPGAAPCNTTLQACINSASAGATVEIASNATIDESPSLTIPLTLQAASGYAPQLLAGRVITVSINSAGTYAVEGIVVQRGYISVTHNSGNATVRLRRNRVLEAIGGATEISIYSPSNASLDYEIAENDVGFFWNTFDGAIRAAIQVIDNGTGNANGSIHDNRVEASGNESAGILVSTRDHVHVTRVFGNWVRGGNRYGSIYLRQGSLTGSGGGSLTGYVVNNIVTPFARTGDAYGIAADAYFGALSLQAFNNTVAGAYSGINVYIASAASGNGRIANNLLAGTILSIALAEGGSGSISNDHNLLFGGSISGTTAGSGTISIDPRLRGAPGNPWLNAGSLAIDAGDSAALGSLLTAAAIARVDAAGLRRFKGGSNAVDIGALEFGDTTFLHRVANASPNPSSVIDNPASNGLASRYLQVTSNWNPDGATGLYDNHPVGAIYSTATLRWMLRHEDLAVFPDDARFNVFVPAAGSGQYLHAVTAANISGDATSLSAVGLDGQSNRIVLASRDSRDPGGTIYDDLHPFGVFYFAFGGPGSWFVSHLDATAMTAGGGFHVYWQEPSANAFVHTTTAGNSVGNTTRLDHPLLNGRRCARFQTTTGIGGSTFNAHQTGVYYTGSNWAIYNQDSANIPLGTEFHVVLDAQQIFECSDVIFANGFD
ncbi:MAG: hypothetical protein IPH43_08845 [Xanthomonadales bacterium]|nr:hypothetical protein [Xanthomonadales bacterium]